MALISFNLKLPVLAAAAMALAVGCETAKRAREVQKTPPPPLENVRLENASFDDLVAFAVSNRADMVAARLAVEDAILTLREISSERSFQLSGTASYGQSTANDSHFSWHQNRGKANVGVNAELLLVDFGRLDAREASARAAVVAAQQNCASLGWGIFNDVADAYFTLLQNDALQEVAETNVLQCAAHLEQARKLFDVGEAKKLDVLRAELDLSDATLKCINASNDVVTATAGLFKVLGLEAGQAAREDILPRRADALSNYENVFAPSGFTALKALERARLANPDLAVLRARVEAASRQVDYAIADMMPQLSLRAGFNFTDPAWNFSWATDAMWSLFTGWRKTTAVDRAVLALKTARLALETAEQTLSRDLDVAVAVRDNARQSLETAKVQVAQAVENMDLVSEQFRVGEANRVDFTDAVGDYASALGVRVKAFYAGQIAEARLISLVGAIDDGPAPDKPENEDVQ